MKTGTIFKTFTAKDGRTVTLRSLKWEDLDDLVKFINSLIDEGAQITASKKVTREQEAVWLGQRLTDVENGNQVIVVAEVDGRVIANSSFSKKTGYSEHVGILGIAIKDGYRDIGIGTELMNVLISKAEDMDLKMLTLSVFASNDRAKHVYEKVGFKETGRIPKELYKDGKYIDHIYMVKELTKFS